MIRVGVVGFGLAGRVFHAPLISSVEGLELAAVLERSTGHAATRYPAIATYRSLAELLADRSIQLVVVATPNSTHFELAMQVLGAGKHVVVDKPMAMSADEIAQMMELAGGLGRQCIPFHNRRWDNDFQTIQKVVQEGSLGMLVHLASSFDRWRPGPSTRAWKEEPAQGGLLVDIGTHLADQALTLFGLPNAVSAEIRMERDCDGAPDAFTLRLHYLNGLIVTLSANTLSTLARPRFHLRGTRGNYWKWGLDPQEEALAKITRIDAPGWGSEPESAQGTLSVDADRRLVETRIASVPGDYRKFYAGVRDAILGTGPAPVQAADAWRVARLLEWARESAQKRAGVDCDWSHEPS
ncbi:MAG TPA: Gfo/Idh/MocA family oxidoreductase [Terracidiphilus sp.]|nr:Gfo/Idh/MocA family oxidoreductase [Terracidiphilus sp.]